MGFYKGQPVGVKAAIIGAAGVIIAAAIGVVATLLDHRRTQTSNTVELKGAIGDSLSVRKVIVAATDQRYRVQITVFNPLARDVLVTQIALSSSSGIPGVDCLLTGAPVYTLESQVVVTRLVPDTLGYRAGVEQSGGPLSGHRYDALGSLSFGCANASFSLTFDAATSIPTGTYTAIYIDLPRRFRVTSVHNAGEHRSLPIPDSLRRIDLLDPLGPTYLDRSHEVR